MRGRGRGGGVREEAEIGTPHGLGAPYRSSNVMRLLGANQKVLGPRDR